MNLGLHTAVVAATLAAGLSAQLTITAANMSATIGGQPLIQQLPRSFDLRSDALQIDQGFEHWWYFRVAGDAREFSLRDASGVSGGVSPAGDHADRDFDDLDGRGLLKASIDYDTYSAGPSSGVVLSRISVTNRAAAPVTIDLFAYVDVDVAGSAGNDSCTATSESHFMTDPTGIQIEVRGVGATGSEVAVYPALRNRLADNLLDDLGPGVPSLSGDCTSAFQWSSVSLQPFEQRTFELVIAVDTPALAVPRVANFGAGNGHVFRIHANDLPLQDLSQPRVFNVRISDALPNAIYRLVTGVDPTTPQPFIPGLDLWVLPASIFAVWGGFTDGNGEASQAFVVPNNAYLTGISVYHQGFYVDAAAPNGFAYWTPGMVTRIGKI